MRHLVAAASAALLLGPGAARAYDLALVLANEDYRHLPDVRAGDDVRPLRRALEDAGFEVVSATNADRGEMEDAVERFLDRAPEADRLMVVLNGRFLKSGRDWFLLPVGSREDETLADAPRRALPVSILMDALDDHPRERAVMVMGTGGDLGEVSPYLERGLVDLSQDQGFVLIGGGASVSNAFAREVLAEPGRSFDVMDARRRGLALSGLEDPPMTFIPGEDAEAGDDGRDAARRAEREAWEAARASDEEESYAAYLDRFPEGAHAQEAEARLDALRSDPERLARQAEEGLGLGREERRGVQAALQVLGFDPRGIDGVFGPGTRSALTEWQRAEGFEPTGYLDTDQIARLSSQAGLRAAEIEAEAEAQRAEARRRDEAFWIETGQGESAEGLRAYLERYPDGLHAERARERLAAMESDARGGAALADAQDWDAARGADTEAAYVDYLDRHPDGVFAEAASARLDALRSQARDAGRAEGARAAEDALGLTPITRGLVEGRLAAFGLEPGPVDGAFDETTRRAIRRYQSESGLEATGYLDQAMVARLLADSILR